MHRKTLFLMIGSVVGVIVIATIAVVVIALTQKHSHQPTSVPTTPTQPKPGTALSAAKTPSYGACSFVTTAQIQTAFGANAAQVSDGTSSGVVATNHQNAETCTYLLSTTQSSSGTLAVTVYGVNSDNPNEDVLDASWAEVSGTKNVSYYKTTTSGKTTNYIFRILNGPTVIQVTLSTPTSDTTFDYGIAMQALQSLEENGDYTDATASIGD